MHVNLPLNKVEPTAAKPAPAAAAKSPAGNFSELLKSAQASAAPTPGTPGRPATAPIGTS